MNLHIVMRKQRTAATHLTLSESILADSLWGTLISLGYCIVSQWHGLKNKALGTNKPS